MPSKLTGLAEIETARHALIGQRRLQTDCDWMRLHFETLYRLDEGGRLLSNRERAPRSVPRFHLGRTHQGNVWRFGSGLDPERINSLSRHASREHPLDRATFPPLPPERLRSFRMALAPSALGPEPANAPGLPEDEEWCGPAFRFPEALLRDPAWRRLGEGSVALMLDDDRRRSLAEDGFSAAALTADPHCRAILEGDRVVALCGSRCCGSDRGGRDSRGSRRGDDGVGFEAWVETLPGERECGWGARCVVAWALAVRAAGAVPLYSARWQDTGALAIARKLGLDFYGEDLVIL